MSRRLQVVLGGALALLLAAPPLVLRLAHAEPPRVSTNSRAVVRAPPVQMPARGLFCTSDIDVPADTRAVRIHPVGMDGESRSGTVITARVPDAGGSGQGKIIARSRPTDLEGTGPVLIGLRPRRAADGVLLCVQSRRATRLATVYDTEPDGGRPQPRLLRFDLLRSARPVARATLAGDAVERAGLFKSRLIGTGVVSVAVLVPLLLVGLGLVAVRAGGDR